jgi:hypothetical protein
VRRAAVPDLVDPRQRLAAALLLTAIDLPADMTGVARAGLQACNVCPGLTLAQVKFGDRVGALGAARDLIDAILQEIAHA